MLVLIKTEQWIVNLSCCEKVQVIVVNWIFPCTPPRSGRARRGDHEFDRTADTTQ